MREILQLVLNGIALGAGYGLVAMSFALIYRTVHFFHFTHAAIYAIAAYVALIISRSSIGAAAAMVAGALGAALVSGVLDVCIYEPLRGQGASPVVMLLVSLGLTIAIQNSISLGFGDAMRMLPGVPGGQRIYGVLGAGLTYTQLTVVVVGVVGCLALVLFLRLSPIGKALRAVADDEELASIRGVNSARTRLWAFVTGSFFAGLAAVVVAFDTGIRPTTGFSAMLIGVAGMIVGGITSIYGAFLGGFCIGLAQQLAVALVDSKWQGSTVFVIMIIFMIARPEGILGGKKVVT
jgi:branched-chain amino acid transport system permease protein